MNARAGSKLWSAYFDYRDGTIDRRDLIRRAGLLGLTGAGLAAFAATVPASAQDAWPLPRQPTAATASITSDEARQRLLERFEVSEPDAEGGIAVIGALNAPYPVFNPLMEYGAPDGPVTSIVFDMLYAIDPVTSEPYPQLLDHWQLADDGVTYTFHLRDDVTWHDGVPFSADDVVFTFDALSSEDLYSPFVDPFLRTVDSFEKVDDFTVEVVATEPMPLIVFLIGIVGAVVAKHVWEEIPIEDWVVDGGSTGIDVERVIGTGPFFLEAGLGSGVTVSMRRFDDYYGQVAILDGIDLVFSLESTSEIDAILDGEIDATLGRISHSIAIEYADDRKVAITPFDTFGWLFAAYNLDPDRTSLFQDVETRQALMYALDREAIVNDIMSGFAEVAHGTQSRISPGYAGDELRTRYEFDRARAEELLADAGWVDSDGDGVLERDGEPFAFTCIYARGDPRLVDTVEFMADAFERIGIAMELLPLDFYEEMLDIISGPNPTFDYEMIVFGFDWDVTGDQSMMFATDSYPGQLNIMKYSNPDADAAMAAANAEPDPDKRRSMLVEANNFINDDCPVQVIYFTKRAHALSPDLRNYVPNQIWNPWYLPYLWIDR